MTLSDVIEQVRGVRNDTYFGHAQIIRLGPADLSQSVMPVSLARRDGPELQEYDEVVIYSVSEFGDRRFVTIWALVQDPGV